MAFHFAEFSVSKHPLLEARQRCRGFCRDAHRNGKRYVLLPTTVGRFWLAINWPYDHRSPIRTKEKRGNYENNLYYSVGKGSLRREAAQKELPHGTPVPGKPGLVTSPFAPDSGYVEVAGYPPGTAVEDPYTGKIFLTPQDLIGYSPNETPSPKSADRGNSPVCSCVSTTLPTSS